MTPLRSITELGNVYGMRFLVRSSLDIPIHDGVVQNEFRLRKALPTIEYLLNEGARVILLTHVGRDASNSTAPIVTALKKYIPITHVPAVVGEVVTGAVAHMKEGTAIMLENVRREEGEEANDPAFSQVLASYADFYVNDAFAVSHRVHATFVGIPALLPSFAGLTFIREYTELQKVLTPEHPSLFILGGAKYETKSPLIQKLASVYTHTFVGGALANDFLKARGFEVGTSLVSPTTIAPEVAHRENLFIPVDVIVEENGERKTVPCDQVTSQAAIRDIGPRTLTILEQYIRDAKTILWNGPLGYYEEGFDAGTKRCAELIAQSEAFSVVGGGDTVAAIESLGLSDKFGFISTAGGAMLTFLEEGTLPGIEALTKD